MKNKILKLLIVLSWLGQILLSIVVAIAVVLGIAITANSEFRQGFSAGVTNGKHVTNNQWIILTIIFILGIIIYTLEIFIIKYVRYLINNIKNEIYFAKNNLGLLKKLLCVLGTFIVLRVGVYFLTLQVKFLYSSDNSFPFGIMDSILFLAVFYVVYLVFKYGLQLQEESDHII